MRPSATPPVTTTPPRVPRDDGRTVDEDRDGHARALVVKGPPPDRRERMRPELVAATRPTDREEVGR